MSKKKAAMSLKDFHGGSIPSDLPLPSAPGIIARPSDRQGYDRKTSWGNLMGRSDQRLRPWSAGAARPFDGKAPFLSNNVQIGRNFDEDDRKPLDIVSGPYRMASDDGIHALPSRMDPKMDYSSEGRIQSRPASSPVTQSSIGTADSSYAARFVHANRVGLHFQNIASGGSYSAFEQSQVGNNYQFVQGSNTGVSASGMHPNAWASKKEVHGMTEQVKMSWSVPDAVSKLAHASALEKVSSGRWHMKQSLHNQSDVEVIEYPESVGEFHSTGNNSPYNRSVFNTVDATVKREYDDVKLARNVEKSLAVDDGSHSAAKESATHRRADFTVFFDVEEKIPSNITDEVQHARKAARFGVSELQSSGLSESTERCKLNLLPRSNPLEDKKTPTSYKKVYQLPNDLGFVDNGNESHGIAIPASPCIAVFDSVNQAVERPKLNLKTRSQLSEKLDGNSERERSIMFGGARPREVVLKEQSIPDVGMNNDLSQLSHRVKQDVPTTETGFVHATPRYNEKIENITNDRGIQKNTDRGGHLVDVERTGTQRRNWRSENWKSDHDFEKQQHPHHPHERPLSPETWRKPVLKPNEAKSDGPAPRYGKAASAVDLALAFSRPISDVKAFGHPSGHRGLPNQDHMPFSRLVDTNSRPQINGF